jgi:hypothetical protein
VFGSFTVGSVRFGICRARGRPADRYARAAHRPRQRLRVRGGWRLAVLALAQGTLTLMAGFALAGLAMAACLYDPAFATLHRISAARIARR